MSPIEQMLDGVAWEVTDDKPTAYGMLYATHSGTLNLFGRLVRCYRLNNGQVVFHGDDVHEFFGSVLDGA